MDRPIVSPFEILSSVADLLAFRALRAEPHTFSRAQQTSSRAILSLDLDAVASTLDPHLHEMAPAVPCDSRASGKLGAEYR